MAEGTETNLCHGSVVQNFGRNVRVLDGLLKMGDEQQVPGLIPMIVKGVVVNLTELTPVRILSLGSQFL